jgi:multiple sugar transport system substrate-binding protein
VPTTIDELDAALAAVDAAGYEGMLVSGAAAGGEFDIFPWTLAYGQNYGAWDRDTLIEVFETFGGWLDAGYIPRDITGWAQNDNYPRFAAGNTAFAQLGNWSLGSARDEIGFDFGVAELPAGPDGSHSIGGGEGFSLTTTAENPEWVLGVFESMFLDQAAEIEMLNVNGCIPARADAASDPAIASDPKLAAYAEVVANLGARPATPLISDYLVEFGTVWNAFVGGQIDAGEAADQLIAKTSEI